MERRGGWLKEGYERRKGKRVCVLLTVLSFSCDPKSSGSYLAFSLSHTHSNFRAGSAENT